MGDLKEKLHEMVELKGKSAIIPPIVGEAIELGRENGIIPLIACKSEGEKLDERMPRLLKPGRESNLDDIDILESIAAKASAVGSWRYEESAVKSDAALLDDCEKGTSQRCKIGTVRVYRAEIVGSMEEATWRQIDAEVSQTIGMQCQIQYQSVNMESRASLDLWPESLSSVDCQDSIPPLVFAASQKPSIFQNLKLTSENTVANQGKERETEDLQTKVELEGLSRNRDGGTETGKPAKRLNRVSAKLVYPLKGIEPLGAAFVLELLYKYRARTIKTILTPLSNTYPSAFTLPLSSQWWKHHILGRRPQDK